MGLKIRGQDNLVTLIGGGDVVEEFEAQDATFETQMSVTSERYLGKSANDYDEDFQGYRVQVSGHAEGSGAVRGVLKFFDQVEKRARREITGYTVNLSSVLLWPNGDQRKQTFVDLKVENPQYSSRGNEFVTFSFTAQCSVKKAS